MSDEQHIHIGDLPMSHEEALDEIERLRGELFTCKADKCEADNRIEELEDDKAFWKNPPNRVWGEKDQIDAAWRSCREQHQTKEAQIERRRVLKILGIERCEACGGSGKLTVAVPTQQYPDSEVEGLCPCCAKFTGHGWVIRTDK